MSTLDTYDKERATAAMQFIQQHIGTHYPILQIALHTHTGTTKLKQIFRQHYGMGLYSYLRQTRMEHAMQLVTTTGIAFKLIAQKTGYRHCSNFITAFSKYHGCTPKQARKKAMGA